MMNSQALRTLCAISLIAMMLLGSLPAKGLVGDLAPTGAMAGQGATPVRGDLQVKPVMDGGTLEAPTGSRAQRGPLGTTDSIEANGYNNQRKLLRDGGTLHAIFTHDGQIQYTNSTDSGITWSPVKTISGTTTTAKHPSMAIAGTHFYFVWEDGANISFRRTPDKGNTWVPPLNNPPRVLKTNFTNPPRNPVVAATNLVVVVVWSGFDGGTTSYEIQSTRSTDNGTVFSAFISLTNGGKNAGLPSISANGTGYYLVYHEGDVDLREIYIRTSANSGASWAAAVAVSNNLGDSIDPNIVSDGTKLYVVWVDISAMNPEVLFKKSTDGGVTWDPNAYLISGDPSRSYGPMLSLVPNGDMYVVWYDDLRDHNFDLFLRRYNATSQAWDPKFQASDLDEGYNLPSTNPYSTAGRVEWIYIAGRQAPYNIYYNFHSMAPNSQPTLTWTGEANYNNGGLFPEQGHTTADTYVFRVNYTDVDDNEPLGTAHVLVDYNIDGRFDIFDNKENYGMNQDDPWDNDYTDGKIYTYSMKFPGTGHYKYRFYALDSANNLATGVGMNTYNFPRIDIVDHAPRLFWTNEKGYSSDGVEPDSGPSSTNFTWHVSYMDEDNNAPASGYPKVLIDLDNDTFFAPEEYFNMSPVDQDDTAYDDGKFYTYSTQLPNVGVYSYRFVGADSWNIPNVFSDKPSAAKTGPTVTSINTAPKVLYPAEVGFSDNGLDPNTGSTSRFFTYRIVYMDAENNSPEKGFPKVWIDKNLDNAFDESEKFTMSSENASNKDYVNGVIYKYVAQFPTVGTYSYRFEARDIYDSQATGKTVGLQKGPDITKYNDAPMLTYPPTEGYIKDGVNPDAGRNSTRFTYRVVYTDINNDSPLAQYPKVWIDRDLDHIKDANEVFTMTPLDPSDTEYDKGVIYTYSTKLDKTGRFSYSFDAWDGTDGQATGAATKVLDGPSLDPKNNNLPRLDWAGEPGYTDSGVYPPSGPSTQTFTFKVKYTDYDNDRPNDGFPKLWVDLDGVQGFNGSNEKQLMTSEDINDTDYTDGRIYVYVTDLGTSFTLPGTFSYIFEAQDLQGSNAAAGKPISQTRGPTITSGNSKPELAWPGDKGYEISGVGPASGNLTTSFIYRVMYSDADNDPPLSGYPKVFIDTDNPALARTMKKEKSTEANYTKGVVYIYNTTLNIAPHRFRFIAFDKYNTMASGADAPMQTSNGPAVEVNTPPVLTWSGDFPKGVDKASATLGKKTTFTVVYSDIDGDPPAAGYPRLLVDMNGDGDFTDPLESIEMVQQTGDYRTGMTYYMEGTLGTGKHTYKFEAKDIRGNVATGDPTQLQEKGVAVKAQSSNQAQAMMVYIVLIVLIIVAAVVAFLVGKRMGGKKAKSAEEAPAPQAQVGYAYDQGPAAYQYQYPPEAYQQQPAPSPQLAPQPAPQAPAPQPTPPPQAQHPPAPPAQHKPAKSHEPAPKLPAQPQAPPK